MTTDVSERRPGATGAPAPPPPRAAAPPTVTTAIVLATASAGGDPAATLAWEDTTVVRRLVEQIAGVGAQAVHVLVRPEGAAAVERALGPTPATIERSDSPSADLRTVARIARESTGGLLVALGDVVTQREVLAGLAVDPRVATGALATVNNLGRPTAPRIRSARGRVVSAASPYHLVHRPTATFLGVLKVGADDRAALAGVAEHLATLTDGALPEGWADELRRKEGMWRGGFARIAARQAGTAAEARTAGLLEVDADLDDDAAAAPEDVAPERPEDIILSEADEAELRRRVAVAPDDVTSLLLAGLVRSGTQVAVNHLRKLFWARTLSPADVERAAEDIQRFDEDKVLLDSAVKAADGFFTTFFVSTYSKYIARWAARRGLTPNQITTVSVLIGLLAAAGFATGERWGLIAGAVLLQIAFTTDCVDGQLARYTRQFSKLGAWLDSVFDRTKEYMVFAGLAIGYAATHADDVWTLAGAALTLQTVRHQMDFAFGAARQQVIGETKHPPIEQPSDRLGAGLRPPAPARAVAPSTTVAPDAVDPPRPVSLPRRVLGLWRKLDRWPGMVWIKRMVAFPIGERFAVISLTAALFDAKVTFVVLLAWGGLAAAYTSAGRILRSVTR
jgi:CDP-alcohol phosphatidyltransferase-like enzyme